MVNVGFCWAVFWCCGIRSLSRFLLGLVHRSICIYIWRSLPGGNYGPRALLTINLWLRFCICELLRWRAVSCNNVKDKGTVKCLLWSTDYSLTCCSCCSAVRHHRWAWVFEVHVSTQENIFLLQPLLSINTNVVSNWILLMDNSTKGLWEVPALS